MGSAVHPIPANEGPDALLRQEKSKLLPVYYADQELKAELEQPVCFGASRCLAMTCTWLWVGIIAPSVILLLGRAPRMIVYLLYTTIKILK